MPCARSIVARKALAAACRAGWLAAACSASFADNPAEVLELPQVDVVGTTPLPGSGVRLRDLPANVQIFTSRDLRRRHAGSLAGLLESDAGSVGVNAAQGNPFQPDLNIRGFSASPLLGTPQGISVFFDGVRINEPFGDSVNWDLIPAASISSIQLIPGFNPAFGLNTLGGALAIYSKSGASEYPDRPGGVLTLVGGSFGRRTVELETGGRHQRWDWFLSANDSRDGGWAMHNASRVRQAFAKLGWQDADTDLDLVFSGADNRLEGTQTLPISFADPREPYTYPDTNLNRAALLSLKGSHAFSEDWLLSGNLYVRRFRNRNTSSNVDDRFGPDDSVQAINDASRIDQLGRGAALQLVRTGKLGRFDNMLSIGLSVDHGRARYSRSAQDAAFTADRGTLGQGDFRLETDADSGTRHVGAFVSDVLNLDPRWSLTLAGRFNRADVRIADRSGSAPELDGAHRFSRFNPALGLTFNPSPRLTLYAGASEGMRAPTAIELTCADPDAPCKLPNSFLSDPPLRKVVSKSIEAGARGQADPHTRWSIAVFRTDLHDDLQFVSSNGVASNAGYFQNVGTTRRQGVEAGGSTRVGRAVWTLRFAWTAATFRSPFAESSPSHSQADAGGAIGVQPGDRIPGIPRRLLKLRAEFEATPRWTVGAHLLASGSVYARGDENNRDANGRVPGYAVLNLDTRLRLGKALEWFARLDNALDRSYANFGILGENVFTGPARSFDGANPRAEQFRGHGAPRGAWAGLQYSFE
ncbi:MAG TPA: TonB-dependent receptor [Albitalea sp.]|nr:TonB-dependent receptor [Albitalea sp.]